MQDGPVSDSSAMIAGMAPVLQPGQFVFCTTADPALAARALPDAIASYREAEGVSMILPVEIAQAMGFDVSTAMACITLTVHSSLEGVGLTAAVATALSGAGISCNMVAAYHHDHVFVPVESAKTAVDVLIKRAATV